MPTYFAPYAYLPDKQPQANSPSPMQHNWHQNVAISVDNGMVSEIRLNATKIESMIALTGPVLPTIANLHSHAFQRVMAGMAETATAKEDSFWSWRRVMYNTLKHLTPKDIETIAAKLYIELLKGGYTQVGEFHYVHNQPDGSPYDQPIELGQAILRAGERVKMGVTLLPALYQYAGFGQQPPNPGQARFVQSTDAYIAQYRRYERFIDASPLHQIGLCFHSLRATDFTAMKHVLSILDNDQPIHIHIAEQQKEINDCLAHCGKRPVEWLLESLPVDHRWALIHATHLTPDEVCGIANCGAVVGICTTTEANLGDGFFPATEFEAAGGIWGVGSDSHVSTILQEELRWLEYGQRLQHQQRNRLQSSAQPSVGDHLFAMAKRGGDRACGVVLGLEIGARADFMVLDNTIPAISACKPENILNRWLFSLSQNAIRDVFVAGEPVIQQGQHDLDTEINEAFSQVIQRLF